MKYKVSYAGFAYVEAKSKKAAEDAYWNGESSFEEEEISAVEQVEEFLVHF